MKLFVSMAWLAVAFYNFVTGKQVIGMLCLVMFSTLSIENEIDKLKVLAAEKDVAKKEV